MFCFTDALPQSIAVSDLLEGVNVLVVLIPVSGGDATLRIDFNYEPGLWKVYIPLIVQSDAHTVLILAPYYSLQLQF